MTHVWLSEEPSPSATIALIHPHFSTRRGAQEMDGFSQKPDGRIEFARSELRCIKTLERSAERMNQLPPSIKLKGTERGRSAAPLIKRFNEIGIEDIPLVGGKNASLFDSRE